MCDFFSFISDGQGNVKYFNHKQRNRFRRKNPNNWEMDSHTSIAAFCSKKANADDKFNKYEYSNGEFIIDQINVKNDSKKVRKWLDEFIESEEFKEICLAVVKNDGCALQYVSTSLRKEIKKELNQ